MIVLKTQARPYANALFELATEENTHQAWHTALTLLNAIITDPDVKVMLKRPSIKPQDWVSWIQSIHSELLGKKEIGHLLSLLAEKRRLRLLPEIYRLFDATWRQSKNEQRFTVKAPAEWTDARVAQFHRLLDKRFHCKAEVNFESHPEMLGGVEVIGEGWRLDYSVKGWLQQLRTQLSV